jgi:hypothetical protein
MIGLMILIIMVFVLNKSRGKDTRATEDLLFVEEKLRKRKSFT